MLHAEMASLAEILYIDDCCASTDCRRERDDQCVADRKGYLGRTEPSSVCLHSVSKDTVIVVCIGDIAVSMSRYRPFSLNAYYDPSDYREEAIECDKEKQISLSE